MFPAPHHAMTRLKLDTFSHYRYATMQPSATTTSKLFVGHLFHAAADFVVEFAEAEDLLPAEFAVPVVAAVVPADNDSDARVNVLEPTTTWPEDPARTVCPFTVTILPPGEMVKVVCPSAKTSAPLLSELTVKTSEPMVTRGASELCSDAYGRVSVLEPTITWPEDPACTVCPSTVKVLPPGEIVKVVCPSAKTSVPLLIELTVKTWEPMVTRGACELCIAPTVAALLPVPTTTPPDCGTLRASPPSVAAASAVAKVIVEPPFSIT